MQNGNAFYAFTQDSLNLLEPKTVIGYYQESLPSETDEILANMVQRFMASKPAEQVAFQEALSKSMRSLFGIFGHRAVTLAVREESPDRLLRGIVGAVIANYVIPEKRRVEVSLAVYHYAARKLGESPADLFEKAADFATPELAAKLHQFGKRGDILLKNFGWQEIKTDEGIRFKFEWG